MDSNMHDIDTAKQQIFKLGIEKCSKCKNCEFDMYGDCDGSGDDMVIIPDADET